LFDFAAILGAGCNNSKQRYGYLYTPKPCLCQNPAKPFFAEIYITEVGIKVG